MHTLAQTIHILFPLIALLFLVYGIRQQKAIPVSTSLWIGLIALMLHYQMSGGELLGSYFNYRNAVIYSFNIFIVATALIYLLSQTKIESRILKAINHLFKAVFITACLLLLTNLWINAWFIETRMPGTPVMQVANLNDGNEHCNYRHVYYKVSKDGSIQYLCPNKYGLLPGTGTLHLWPEFIAQQLPHPILKNILQAQQEKNAQNAKTP